MTFRFDGTHVLKALSLAVLIGTAVPSGVFASDYVSASFIVRDPVVDAGGGYSSSASFQNLSSFSQTNLGIENSSSFIDCNGFLYFEGASVPALSGTSGSGQASLTWTPASGVCGNVVTSYELGTSTTLGGPYTFQNVGSVTSYVKTSLTNGTPYYFVARALSGSTTLSTSNEATVTPNASVGGGGGNNVSPPVNCGNGVCDNNETVTTCPLDCRAAPTPVPVVPPVTTDVCSVDCGLVSYDLYIVNPNGTEVHSGSSLVKTVAISADTIRHSFEDGGGASYDYDDLVIEVKKSDCRYVGFEVVGRLGAWHHQVWVTIYYDGQRKRNVLLWEDSATAVGVSRVIDATTVDICQAQPSAGSELKAGDLVKGSCSTVYYYGSDGQRHAFPNANTYRSWFGDDFSKVKSLTTQQVSALPLGPNVRYRPASRLLKIVSDPKVYAVAARSVLRWVMTGDIAAAIFGGNWSKLVDDLDAAFFTDYSIGAPIVVSSDYNPKQVSDDVVSIDETQEFIGSATATKTIITPACVTPAPFRYDLKRGQVDVMVKPLQSLLQCLGFFPKDVDVISYYGPITEEAVRAFQRSNCLSPVGFLSVNTRTELNRFVQPIAPRVSN